VIDHRDLGLKNTIAFNLIREATENLGKRCIFSCCGTLGGHFCFEISSNIIVNRKLKNVKLIMKTKIFE
jgi:hypothetical protein